MVREAAANLLMLIRTAIGVDGYNQSVTGEVTMTVTCAASDFHHVPLVIEKKEIRRKCKRHSKRRTA